MLRSATPSGGPHDDPTSLPSLSLESRLRLLHRRRRLTALKHVVASIMVVAISILVLFAAFGAVVVR
jgi:hypothetical protein